MRLDLHTHTFASGDASTLPEELAASLGPDDVVAVTDHHELSVALALREAMPGHVIVGEEIRTRRGELIGLFLHDQLPRGGDPFEVARRIRDQGGLVWVPHPTDPRRASVGLELLEALLAEGLIDVVEVGNAKCLSLDAAASQLAHRYEVATAAASDAHVPQALFAAYVEADGTPETVVGSPLALLAALASGRVVFCHADPVRPWPRPVVPGF